MSKINALSKVFSRRIADRKMIISVTFDGRIMVFDPFFYGNCVAISNSIRR